MASAVWAGGEEAESIEKRDLGGFGGWGEKSRRWFFVEAVWRVCGGDEETMRRK